MDTLPQVSAVILNTNRRADTLEALASLNRSDYPNFKVIVLDNASNDGSVEAIHADYPNVEVICLEKNLGYAGNNNVGIKAALERGADWVFVLNEDTLLAEDCISCLIAYGVEHSRAGILGPLVYHSDEPGVIQSAGGRMDENWVAWHLGQNEKDEGQYSQPRVVEWISGCAILVRGEVIEQAGMLDERFFYYFEETEWCVRARKAGWQIVNVPTAKLWHKGVQRNYKPGPNVTYYATRNRFLMFMKHQAPLNAWLTAWSQVLRTLAAWTFKPRWRGMVAHRDALWQGTWDFLRRHYGMR